MNASSRPADPGSGPERSAITARAEKLWRDRQCPEGCDEVIWLEAERQLKSEGAAPPAPRPGTKSRDPAEQPGALRAGGERRPPPKPGTLRSQ